VRLLWMAIAARAARHDGGGGAAGGGLDGLGMGRLLWVAASLRSSQ
jgi:hypothetical protein